MRKLLHGVSILAVDDDEDSLEMLSLMLEDQGATVRSVGSASDAVAATDEWIPDVMLIDIALPDVDGYELLRLLRERPKLAKTPAVAVSGYAFATDKAQAFKVGFAAHMSKPIDPVALIELAAWLVSREEGAPVSSSVSYAPREDRSTPMM